MIIHVIVVLRRTVVGGDDWHFENLSRSHHQSPLTSSGSIDFVDDFRSVKRGRGKGRGRGRERGRERASCYFIWQKLG